MKKVLLMLPYKTANEQYYSLILILDHIKLKNYNEPKPSIKARIIQIDRNNILNFKDYDSLIKIAEQNISVIDNGLSLSFVTLDVVNSNVYEIIDKFNRILDAYYNNIAHSESITYTLNRDLHFIKLEVIPSSFNNYINLTVYGKNIYNENIIPLINSRFNYIELPDEYKMSRATANNSSGINLFGSNNSNDKSNSIFSSNNNTNQFSNKIENTNNSINTFSNNLSNNNTNPNIITIDMNYFDNKIEELKQFILENVVNVSNNNNVIPVNNNNNTEKLDSLRLELIELIKEIEVNEYTFNSIKNFLEQFKPIDARDLLNDDVGII